jgi:hypothetical protein
VNDAVSILLIVLFCFPVLIWLSILLHELGHFLYGLLNGFRALLIYAYPLGIEKKGEKWEFFMDFKQKRIKAWGASLTVPTEASQKSVEIFKWSLLFGILTNLFAGLCCYFTALEFLRTNVSKLPYHSWMSVLYLLLLLFALCNLFNAMTVFVPVSKLERSICTGTDLTRFIDLSRKDAGGSEARILMMILINYIIYENYEHLAAEDIAHLKNSDNLIHRFEGAKYTREYYIANNESVLAELEMNDMKKMLSQLPKSYINTISSELKEKLSIET